MYNRLLKLKWVGTIFNTYLVVITIFNIFSNYFIVLNPNKQNIINKSVILIHIKNIIIFNKKYF